MGLPTPTSYQRSLKVGATPALFALLPPSGAGGASRDQHCPQRQLRSHERGAPIGTEALAASPLRQPAQQLEQAIAVPSPNVTDIFM